MMLQSWLVERCWLMLQSGCAKQRSLQSLRCYIMVAKVLFMQALHHGGGQTEVGDRLVTLVEMNLLTAVADWESVAEDWW